MQPTRVFMCTRKITTFCSFQGENKNKRQFSIKIRCYTNRVFLLRNKTRVFFDQTFSHVSFMLHIIILFNPLVTLLHHHIDTHIYIHIYIYICITRSIPQRQEWDTCPVRIEGTRKKETERMALLLTM